MAADAKVVDEKLCNNCGKCCYKKIIVGRTVFITPFPCEFLDTATNLCTIYDKRHELNPLCLSVKEGMKVSAFPEDCPYVPEHAPKNYKPARDEWSWDGEWEQFDELADDLDVSIETRQRVRERGRHAPPMYVETNARIEAERTQAVSPLNKAGLSGVLEQSSAQQIPPSNSPLVRGRTGAVLWGNTPGVISMAHETAPPPDEVPVLAELVRGRKAPTSGEDRR